MMELLDVNADGAAIEIAPPELAALTDLVEQALGRQERGGPLDRYVEQVLDQALGVLIQGLHGIWGEQERRGPPFRPGEVVQANPAWSWSDEEFPPTATATVVSQNRRDRAHDFDWCAIRFPDGSQAEVADGSIRRVG
jgi:hypothetical protein